MWLEPSGREPERVAGPDGGGEWLLGATLRRLGPPALTVCARDTFPSLLFSVSLSEPRRKASR